jgi:hypothetical protein
MGLVGVAVAFLLVQDLLTLSAARPGKVWLPFGGRLSDLPEAFADIVPAA